MKKRKVIAFFVVLFIFAGILAVLQIIKFGNLTGFSTNPGKSIMENPNLNSDIIGFLLLIFVFFIIFGAISRIIKRRNDRVHAEMPHRRRLISLEMAEAKR